MSMPVSLNMDGLSLQRANGEWVLLKKGDMIRDLSTGHTVRVVRLTERDESYEQARVEHPETGDQRTVSLTDFQAI